MFALRFMLAVVVMSASITSLANADPPKEEKPAVTKPSRRAIPSALKWLANHQAADGHWSFGESADPAKRFANPGTWKSDAGATGLALLPFLVAGQSHKADDRYKNTVATGIRWLLDHQAMNGDLSAGGLPQMLSHAWATLALSEDYGLTGGSSTIGMAAQRAVTFIEKSQDKTGGWIETGEKTPRLSLTTWQMLVLYNARVAGLDENTKWYRQAAKFVKLHGDEQQIKFGETGKHDVSDRSTAMGLVCRWNTLQFGQIWRVYRLDGESDAKPPPDPKQPGASYLLKLGPGRKDVVYNFYATMFLCARDGYDWDDWNRTNRAQSVKSQVLERDDTSGPEDGSWYSADDAEADTGGRLFQIVLTALALETLHR